MNNALTAEELMRAVHGGIGAYAKVHVTPHRVIQHLRAQLPDLILTTDDVGRVLHAFAQDAVSSDQVQAWASFVRRGYTAGQHEPIVPIAIAYEAEHEHHIAEVVSRLDELGDSIDGELPREEVRAMVRALTEVQAPPDIRLICPVQVRIGDWRRLWPNKALHRTLGNVAFFHDYRRVSRVVVDSELVVERR